MGRPGYSLNDAKRTTIGNLLGGADNLQTLVYQWSGGLPTSPSASPIWQELDFAPDTVGTRTWRGTGSNRQGLDEMISLVGGSITYSGDTRTKSMLQNIRDSNAAHASAKAMLVMHNHPKAMVPPGWTDTTDGLSARDWPRREQWGGNKLGGSSASELALEIWNRYGSSYIRGFSHGQEIKQVNTAQRAGFFPGGTLIGGTSPATVGGIGNLTPNNLIDYIEGFNHFALAVRASMPSAELWFGHLDIFGHSNQTECMTSIDAMVAGGGSLPPGPDLIIDEMIARIGRDPTGHTFPARGTFNPALLPDKFTIDVSVGQTGGSPRYANDYAAMLARVSVAKEIARVITAKMEAVWDFAVPIVLVESYFDWNQPGVTFTPAQQAVLSTAIAMQNVIGGIYEEDRWEEQGGDLTNGTTKLQSFASWYTPYDAAGNAVASPNVTVYDQFLQVRDLSNAFPPGTVMQTTSSDTSGLLAIASANRAYLLNTTGSPITASVATPNGTVSGQVVAAMSYLVVSLPTSSGATPGTASGSGAANAPALVLEQRAHLTIGF